MMYTLAVRPVPAVGADTQPGSRPGPRILGELAAYETADRLSLRRRLPARGGQRQLAAERPAGRGRPRQWNERYEFPKIILCHNAEFFEYIEKHYGDKLPVFRGSAGTYWEDGAGSSARETTLCRNAHEAVANGEKFLALAERIGQAQAVSGRGDRPGLAQLPALRRAHLGRLLLDQPAGQRVHQGPVEDQGPVRRRRRPSRPRRSWTRARRALAVAGADRRARPGGLQSRRAGRGPTCAGRAAGGHGRGRAGRAVAARRRTARSCWSRTCRPAAIAC